MRRISENGQNELEGLLLTVVEDIPRSCIPHPVSTKVNTGVECPVVGCEIMFAWSNLGTVVGDLRTGAERSEVDLTCQVG
jgi:hypothetical protein